MFYNINTRAQCYKTFYGRILRIFEISWSVCPWQAFPVKSNVWGKPALFANIRLGWEGLRRTNTLAYYEYL
jgi:hypothetical protein